MHMCMVGRDINLLPHNNNAHKSFAKSFKGRSDEPVYELYRNGIVHGTLTNYNNVVIATKAWNRLFAVADWASATDAQQNSTKEASEVTWQEIVEHIKSNADVNAALDAFTPITLTSKDDALFTHPAYIACTDFLSAWKSQNYGHMAKTITKALGGPVAPIQVRNDYQAHNLTHFHINAIEHHAAAVAMVSAELTVDGETLLPELRWMREDENGQSVAPNQSGDWRLVLWGYSYMIQSRGQQT